jgi:hypothetical protein
MSYNRILTPRFFINTPTWLFSRGLATSEWEKITGTYNGSPNDIELMDGNVANRVSFDTSGNTGAHIFFQMDLTLTGSIPIGYVAILNHNLSSADGRIRVMHTVDFGTTDGTTENKLIESGQNFSATVNSGDRVVNTTDSTLAYVTNVDSDTQLTLNNDIMVSGESYNIFTTVSGLASVVNGTVDSDGGAGSEDVADPPYDGSTIITFDEVTNKRYWAIEIEDDSAFSGTDLEMGLIQLGEVYTMPNAPDLAVKRSFSQDGVAVMESAGGKRYANARWLRGSTSTNNQFGQPFRVPYASYLRRPSGRQLLDMQFSYINDTDLLTSDLEDITSGDTTIGDVWMKTGGELYPFIFTPDSTSTTSGDYLWARFGQNSLDMTQVANDVWNIKMRIEEEF